MAYCAISDQRFKGRYVLADDLEIYYATPRGPKCISIFELVTVTIYTECVYLAENSPGQIRIQPQYCMDQSAPELNRLY